jgi:hypothetical protein
MAHTTSILLWMFLLLFSVAAELATVSVVEFSSINASVDFL